MALRERGLFSFLPAVFTPPSPPTGYLTRPGVTSPQLWELPPPRASVSFPVKGGIMRLSL